ncbi:MAG: tRNA pseudouridine(55) synthase TruB [Nitrospinae bacterium]|nr:tRNA pseudouridine(55) synthase TruB [Nitrospinota bacterium]
MDGFINFYKDTGMASNKALERIKKLLRLEKAGFLGTLDPVATGILPVACGWGTRFFPYFEKGAKKYRATIIFGAETDTQDSTGKITATQPTTGITEERLLETMNGFKGEIDQTPPMYSAKKINGKRLYEIARKGGEVERKPKRVVVHSLELDEFNGDTAVFTALVSQGTYIRTLCEDMGRKLGSAAHMGALERTEAHVFRSDGSWTIERLEERRDFQNEWLLPLDFPLGSLPRVAVTEREEKSLLNGRFIFHTGDESGPTRIYTPEGIFIGVGRADHEGKKISPEKIMNRWAF